MRKYQSKSSKIIFRVRYLLRPFFLITLPLSSGIAVFLLFNRLILPSIVMAILVFIMVYFWWLLKEVLSATLKTGISFLLLVFMFVVVIYFILKYNGGDIAWNVNVFEIFGLDR